MPEPYHADESCTRDFTHFVAKVNPYFARNQRSLIISQFEKCIVDRKSDKLYKEAHAKSQSEWVDKDWSHHNVVVMFEKLLEKISPILEDRLNKYHLKLQPTRGKAVSIHLNKDVAHGDKVVRHEKEGAKEVGEGVLEKQIKDEKAAADAAAAAAEKERIDKLFQSAMETWEVAHKKWTKEKNGIENKNKNRSSINPKPLLEIPLEPVKPKREDFEGGRRRTRRKNGRRRTQKKRKTYV